MSGDHYEMIGKVAFGLSRPGGGCTGCMGVNNAWTPRWFKKGVIFAPPPPFKGPKCLRGAGVKDFTWAPPMVKTNLFLCNREHTGYSMALQGSVTIA